VPDKEESFTNIKSSLTFFFSSMSATQVEERALRIALETLRQKYSYGAEGIKRLKLQESNGSNYRNQTAQTTGARECVPGWTRTK
jgi:hypothetical protein